jgi:dCTP diphosphatase
MQRPATKNLNDLKSALRAFARERDWDQFHAPKNLAMAIAIEAAELMEEFQWLTPEASAQLPAEKLAAVRLEMADVLLYLVRLADKLDIDLLEAAADKLVINAQKYPAEKVRGKSAKYDQY